jgi:hypothetical protein
MEDGICPRLYPMGPAHFSRTRKEGRVCLPDSLGSCDGTFLLVKLGRKIEGGQARLEKTKSPDVNWTTFPEYQAPDGI